MEYPAPRSEDEINLLGGPPGSPLILDSSVEFQSIFDLLGAVEW
jgi:hypothetical protein